MRKILTGAICAAALLIAAAGCGGSDTTTQTVTVRATAPPSATTGASTTAEAADREADQEIADAAQLKLSDFPSGWTASPSEDDDESDATTCSGWDKLVERRTASSQSPDFAENSSFEVTQVNQTASVFPDESTPREMLSLFNNQDFIGCFADAFVDYLQQSYEESGKDLDVKDATVSMLRVEDHGDESAGVRAAFTISGDGQEAQVTLDTHFVRVGRAITMIATVSTGDAMSDSERDELAGISAERLAAALER